MTIKGKITCTITIETVMNSKEKLFMVRLFVRELFFFIFVSDVAIISKYLFVQLNRCSNSLRFLFREHAFI